MEYTPAAASMLLKTLQEEHENLINAERSLDTFGAPANEDPEKVRPAYDYAGYQKKLDDLETKIRTVQHAINEFQVTTVLPGTGGLTVDQALVYLPQLKARKRKLTTMAMRLAMEYMEDARTVTKNELHIRYANYSIDEAKADYEKTDAAITAIQSALDQIEHTQTFAIDV